MGLLRKLFKYLLLVIIFTGCGTSIIKITTFRNVTPYPQYGKIPQREFYSDITLNPSFTEKWEAEINGGFSNSSVIIYDDAVLVNDLSGRIFCFSISSGKRLGQLKYKGSINAAPVIYNSILIFALVNKNENITSLIFYDFKQGIEKAEAEIKGIVTSELLKLEDGVVFITEAGHVYKYDFWGKLIWEIDKKVTTHSSPASDNSVIIFGTDSGEIICLAAENGETIYRKKIAAPILSGVVISDNNAYLGDDAGRLYSVMLKDGSIVWSFQTNSKIRMEPVVYNNDVFIGNLIGDLFKISAETGNLVWKTKTNGLLNVTPSLTKNILIVPDEDRKIHIIDVKTGENISSIPLEGRVKLSPVIYKNLLFIGYENGYLKAFEITYE